MKSALGKSWTMTLNCVETSTVLYALQQDARQPEECLELERIPCIFRSALNQTPRTDFCQDDIARVLMHQPHAA
jgi:hypothetical protein